MEPSFELQQTVADSARRLRASPDQLAKASNPHVDRLSGQSMYLGIAAPQDAFLRIAEDCHARYAATAAER